MPVNLNPSNSDPTKFKVAAVQAEPAWLDLQGGVEKTIRIVIEAAEKGAKIIGLPEVFIPGAPPLSLTGELHLHDALAPAPDILAKYHANSLAVHSPEMDQIREAVKKLGVYVVLGFSERDGGSLYIAQVTISPKGEIVNHRRKIKPTHYEKTIFGDGNAQSIHNVVQTPYGRLGSLNCWEHIQPALKLHFFSQLPQIFVGGWWPAFKAGAGGSPYIVSGEASSRMTQSVAMEGGCFGLVACHVVSEKGAEIMKMKGFPWFEFPGGGFTTIYGPDGSALTPPIDSGVEETAIAEISLDQIATVKTVADQMGNYSRHDLFHLVAHGKNWGPVKYEDPEEAAELEAVTADIKNVL
ncbi:hypothetical protein EWM64_g2675 [Hericium alpestre]|uniref:CN hydrolase domain-containing protein n=1 Tax=Hericium alpestre TaxID=135208 RepID=A0A4Z0A4T7_9AGAM|nr:hypothetical protein EWM64_g2675 [Hericium alpestre]